MVQQVQNGAATFFVKHRTLPGVDLLALATVELRISFYSVLFRLSTGKGAAGIPLSARSKAAQWLTEPGMAFSSAA